MFPLSVENHRAYVEQITQAGLTAMRIRGCEVSADSESKTRQEAEGLVQGTYSQSKSFEEMLGKITKMVKKLDPFTQANTFLLNRPLLTRLVSADHPLVQRDPALLTSILNKGEDAASLVMHMDEILKANSLAKAYRLQEAEVLLGLAPRIDKLYNAALTCSSAAAAAASASASAAAGAGAVSTGIGADAAAAQSKQVLVLASNSSLTRESEHLMQVCVEMVPRIAEAVRCLAMPSGLQIQVSFCLKELSVIVQAHVHRMAGTGAGAGIWPGDRMKSQTTDTATTASLVALAQTTHLSLTLCRLFTALVVSQRAVHAAPATSPASVGGVGGVGMQPPPNVLVGYSSSPQAPIFNLAFVV